MASGSPDTAPALLSSVAAVRALFAAAACSCALVDAEGETLTFVAADGIGAAEITGVSIPVSRGIAGWAAMSGQPISVRDVAADPRFARDVAESTNYVPTTVMATPMLTGDGDVVGVMEVLDPGVDEAADWTLAVLGTLGSQLAGLVQALGQRDDGPGSERKDRLARLVEEVAGSGPAAATLAEDVLTAVSSYVARGGVDPRHRR